MQETKADYYVVRVYRQERAADGQRVEVTGLVETAGGKRLAFHNMEELWRILRNHPTGTKNA